MRISRDRVVYRFSRDDAPIAHIAPGETCTVETLDAASGRIKRPEDVLSYRTDPNRVNPATGPLFVEGAEPGDTLAVEILEVRVASSGYRVLHEGAGVLLDRRHTKQAMIVRIEGEWAVYDERIRLPIRPMVGTIGVAPAGAPISTFHPGPHGGNMDNNHVRAGTFVHLPVSAPGALLAIGDLHASMGDGELTGGGIDIDGEVTFRTSLVKGRQRPRPWLETPHHWVACANAPDLERAIAIATGDMVDFLSERLGITPEFAYMLVGSHGDARIGQAASAGVDVTVGLAFPRLETQRG